MTIAEELAEKETIKGELREVALDLLRMGMFALARKVERGLGLLEGKQAAPDQPDPHQLDLLGVDRVVPGFSGRR